MYATKDQLSVGALLRTSNPHSAGLREARYDGLN